MEIQPLPYNVHDVKVCFIDAVRQTLINRSTEQALRIRGALIDILGTTSPAMYASPEMMQTLTDKVFKNEELRGWLFDTKYTFFMQVAGGAGFGMVKSIINDIALAASEDMGAMSLLEEDEVKIAEQSVIMPTNIFDDLPQSSAVRVVLVANTWMIVLMLLFAFVDMEHEVLAGAPTPGK